MLDRLSTRPPLFGTGIRPSIGSSMQGRTPLVLTLQLSRSPTADPLYDIDLVLAYHSQSHSDHQACTRILLGGLLGAQLLYTLPFIEEIWGVFSIKILAILGIV